MNTLRESMNRLGSVIASVVENIGRIFKPNDDHYPATGVVPFTDDPNA
ncbi:MAG: hypothetical protein MH252_13450 [Thermosynechococcaceae cyanobacterium MS004]|nr:hypothetical protein [Thermosynechococcaceae cyanobacterium MS004]